LNSSTSAGWFFPGTLGILGLLNLLLYGKNLTDYFVGEDFLFIRYGRTLSGAASIIPEPGSGWFRPLYHLSFFLDYQVWNLNPFGYHLTNFILNLFCIVLVGILAYLIFQNRWPAFLAASFFAISPLHPEPVINLSARVDLIVTLFATLAIVGFIAYRRYRLPGYYLMSLAAFILALLSKESAIILPLFFVAYDLTFTRGLPSHPRYASLVIYLPFILLLIIYFGVRFYFLGNVGGYAGFASSGSIGEQATSIIQQDPGSLAASLGRALFLPVNLEIFNHPKVALVFPLILFVLIMTSFRSFSNRKFLFSLAFLVVSAVPLVGALPIPENMVNSRYLYLTSIGIALSLAAIVSTPGTTTLIKWAKGSTGALLAILMTVLVIINSEAWSKVSHLTSGVISQTHNLYPQAAAGSEFFFFGIPHRVAGIPVFLDMSDPVSLIYDPAKVEGYHDFLPQDQAHNDMGDGLGKDKFALFWDNEKSRMEDVTAVLLQSEPLAFWGEEELHKQWTAKGLRWENGQIVASGSDPSLTSPELKLNERLVKIEVKMRITSSGSGYGQVYFATASEPSFREENSVRFKVYADDQWHTYNVWTIVPDWDKTVQRLRFDPTNFRAKIDLDSVRLFGR